MLEENASQLEAQQKEFIGNIQLFANHLHRRIKDINSRFEASYHQEPNKKQIYDDYWKKRLRELMREAEKLKRVATLRPSLCVMGKRGQGKTSLLQSWLGKKTGQQQGIEEMAYLPTGEADTTACLIRLTEANTDNIDLSPYYLHVELFPAHISPEIDQLDKPTPPYNLVGKTIRLARQISANDEVKQDDPYRVCRFPVKHQRDDDYRFEENNEHYVMGLDGTIHLTELQWHAKQVRLPILSKNNMGLASEVLRVLDVIDAPGADSMEQGDYPGWKRAKNEQVFITATHELDVLLVVSSANVDAMNIGGQFMDNVWKPWLKRCQGNGLGRILLAVTHAAYPFKKARDLLKCEDWRRERNENPDAPQPEGCHSTLNESNFRYKVVQNVLEPLMYKGLELMPIINQTDLTTWPLMFFFEERHEELKPFEIVPGTANEVADKLIQLLQTQGNDACTDTQLPLGERCVLRLVQDWSDLHAIPEQRAAVQHWLIRALTATLDAEDRGFSLFTDTVVKYATIGPVAVNHCQERLKMAEDLWRHFRDLLNELGHPDNRINALSELQKAQAFLQAIWQPEGTLLRGPQLKLGAACQQRREKIDYNNDPTILEKEEFDFNDIVADIVNDVLEQLPNLTASDEDSPYEFVKRSLQESLKHDYPLLALIKRYESVFQRKKDILMRIQAVAMERIIRIMDYLVYADEAGLRKIATYCYEENLDMAAMLRFVLEGGIGSLSKEDETVHQQMINTGQALLTAIETAKFNPPYVAID